ARSSSAGLVSRTLSGPPRSSAPSTRALRSIRALATPHLLTNRCAAGRRPHYAQLFFFQAEDGIRDPLVTGVQTCALPISERPSRRRVSGHAQRIGPAEQDLDVPGRDHAATRAASAAPAIIVEATTSKAALHAVSYSEIGRASCRERGEDSEVAESGKRRAR